MSNTITKPSELLIAAKALIADPAHFTSGVLARDANNDEVSYTHPDAVCFCSYGAVAKVAVENNIDYLDNPMYAYLERTCGTSIATFNDTHTHSEVMAMWDAAIALAVADETGDELMADGL